MTTAMMSPKEEAIVTCQYACNLGLTALKEHFSLWLEDDSADFTEDELLYIEALIEIKSKLGTEQCLLRQS